nr:hypothetical protein [Tanacetum cinerariifolium]
MSNTNNTMQTQTSNTLHNVIMEAGGKDRPPTLAPDKVVPVTEGSFETTIKRYMENYKNVSQDIHDQLNAKAEAVQIILTGIDNDIYSTVDACPNACEMWKAIEMLKQDDEMSKDKEIDKLMALIFLLFKKIYKPTNNNLRTSPNTSRANPDNFPRISRGTGYENQMIGNVVGARDTVEQADLRDNTDDEPKDQELEAHYMYMAQIQELTPDAANNSGPIFDTEPLQKLVEIILFIIESGCSKHMTRNLKLLINYVEKFLGTVKFGNDQIAPIISCGDLVQGAVTIKRVYYVEGLNYNLFSVGQFCDVDLEVAFRKSTCYIRDLKGNDLLTGSRGTDLSSPNPICLMAKATSSQAWLWHRRLSHPNFDYINLLSKNDIVIGLPKLKFVKDHLCSSFVDDYSRYTWTYFLRSKDETPKVLIDFLRINHQTSIARTPDQNGVVERRSRTLVEAARTMLSAAKVPLFFGLKQLPLHVLLKTVHSDGENLDKMKEKGNACIFLGYSTQSRAYRVFNKRTRVIVETIHVNFDELPQMASDHVSSDPIPQCQRTALEHNSLSLGLKCQENVPHAAGIVTTSNELDLLFSLMFDELLNGSSQVVSKSFAETTADAWKRIQSKRDKFEQNQVKTGSVAKPGKA